MRRGDAAKTGGTVMLAEETLLEAKRQFMLCNGCRICHDYCSVFPAMEQRRTFASKDIMYLANLCHDCRACLPVCPFISKNDRAIDVPAIMTQARAESYEHFARPRWAWRLVRSPWSRWTFAALVFAFFLTVALSTGAPGRITAVHNHSGSFYDVIGHWWIVVPATAAAVLGVVVIVAGGLAFWRETGGKLKELFDAKAHSLAMNDVLIMRNMDGGGSSGCNYPGDQITTIRRRLHFAVFYGFMACFASTVVAAFEQEILKIDPPYSLLSAPVILGVLGGIGLLVGCIGFLFYGVRSRETRKAEATRRLDRNFTATLLVVAVTGLATLMMRSTPAMGLVLMVHLAAVASLLLLIVYGKLVHAPYRYLALVKFQIEERSRRARSAARSGNQSGGGNQFGGGNQGGTGGTKSGGGNQDGTGGTKSGGGNQFGGFPVRKAPSDSPGKVGAP
jgi:citrate/tricarballylate utilization protein